MVIMTGGHGSETRVQSYDLSGPLARLPDLRSGRINHGCGHYVHNGKLVSVEIDYVYLSNTVQNNKIGLGRASV